MIPSRPSSLARAALLLALTLVFQSLRLVIPIPPFFSTFIIGSLVNACLLIAAETTGLAAAVTIAVITPVVAYLQGFLFLPVFILPVAAAHTLFVLVFRAGFARGRMIALVLAAVVKTACLFAAFTWLLSLISVPPKLAAGMMFVMGWPQLVTAGAGGILATIVTRRLSGRP
jgi:hypothetical protein